MLYLGIDPGRGKTGLALVKETGEILRLHVAETKNIGREIKDFLKGDAPDFIVIGDGTNSAPVKEIAESALLVPAVLVGEAHSTEEARALYWEENPPKGLKKMLPKGMLVPPVPLDGYAAVILVRRYLKEK